MPRSEVSTITASVAGLRGATARLRSMSSRWRIISVICARSAGSPLACNSSKRRIPRTSGRASRKNLNRAVGNTTVPMSRPSATRPDSPSDRCASFRQSRTTVDVARREASRPTSAVRISGPTGTPLHSNTECSPPPCSLKRKALQRARNSSSGNASAPGPRRRAMVRNMAPVSR